MLRVLPLALACLLLPGCFVFDEIDAGMEMMERTGPQKPAEQAAPAKGEAEKPAGREWWSKAQSFSPGSGAADAAPAGDPKQLVSCRLGGGTRFMRRADCVSQGGAPKS